MKHGIDVPNLGMRGDPHLLVDLAVEAELAGWDGFFVLDSIHLASDDPQIRPTCDPWIALAGVAGQTKRVRIGTMGTPVARRRPWKLARETVSLDRLSGGRLVLPVALGSLRDGGFSSVGEPLDRADREAHLDEGLEILTGLWKGRPFSFEGKHYQVSEMTFQPTPLQRPRIPIWMVAAWPREPSMQRALRWDGVLPFKMDGREGEAQEGWSLAGGLQPDDVAELTRWVAERRDSSRPFDIVLSGATSEDNPRKALEIVRPYEEAGATWWMEASAWQAMWKHPGDIEAIRRPIQRGPPC